ncbi:hypothetical protein EIP86_011238 [Pleurotus ostreatoroseus]|nr:hypothetical protein EIP86_011238 [Pleurotus ostreatoroseus]
MPPRPRTRSASKKSTDASVSTDKTAKNTHAKSSAGKRTQSNTRKRATKSKSAKAQGSAVQDDSELLEGLVEELQGPVTIKGSSTSRRKPSPKEQDIVDQSDADVSVDDNDVDDLNVADDSDPASDIAYLLDLEAEEEEGNVDNNDQEIADLNLDEDSSAYESSFIDDSALHEDDEENAEDAPDENVANVADDEHADMDIEDDDDKPIVRPAKKINSTKRRTVLSDDEDSPSSKRLRTFNEDDFAEHPLNRKSDLHQFWFGHTDRMSAWSQWREDKILNNSKLAAVAGTKLEAAFMLQYNELNYITDNDLLQAYSQWRQDSMKQRSDDPAWMSQFADDGPLDDLPTGASSQHTPTKGKKSSSSTKQSTSSSKKVAKVTKTPTKDAKGKGVLRTVNKTPSAPNTPSSALAAGLLDLSLVPKESLQWLKVVKSTETAAPILPSVSMEGLQDPCFAYTPGSGNEFNTIKFAENVICSERYALSTRATIKLTDLVCKPTHGPWLYNFALVPLKALVAAPDASGTAENQSLHRRMTNPPKSHRLVAGIMFGEATAPSTLLAPVLTKTVNPMWSKSITMKPINEHFSRIMSLGNKFFDHYPLKIGLYAKGLAFRTRMMSQSSQSSGGNRFVPLQTGVSTTVSNKIMPTYLSKVQLVATEDDSK